MDSRRVRIVVSPMRMFSGMWKLNANLKHKGPTRPAGLRSSQDRISEGGLFRTFVSIEEF